MPTAFSRYRRRLPRKTSAGFTLIELMLVVAVVAILASIAYPTYNDSVRKSRRGQAKADLVVLAQRAERYYTLNNSYAGFWASVASADKRSPREGTVAYTLARADDASLNEFVLSATPVGDQAADTACGTLSINQAGVRARSGRGDISRCW